jgi:hypothetical protein
MFLILQQHGVGIRSLAFLGAGGEAGVGDRERKEDNKPEVSLDPSVTRSLHSPEVLQMCPTLVP